MERFAYIGKVGGKTNTYKCFDELTRDEIAVDRAVFFTDEQGYEKNGKPFFGIGHYTKSNAEVCLLAIRGRPKVVSNYVSSVIISPREEHSKKPDEARDRIVQLCGDLPRIELFARQRVSGWDCWGLGV